MSTYLLAIGINHYTDRAFRALSCCENDASEIHALFKRNLELGDRASKLVGAVSIADVKNELRRIGQEIRNGDTFVLFFAGHGYQHPKREDQFLLFPEAEARLVNKGYLDGMLSLSALCELTEHWAGVARVFILDACRSWLPGRDASGARFDNEVALAYIASRDPAFGPDNAKPADSPNSPGGALPPVILNATRNGQEAKELEDRQRGVLALALEQTLESRHKSGDVIWLGEQMLTDVNQRMNELLQHGRLGVEQTPFLTPPSARVLLFKPQRTVEAPNTDDDETEWAIACAKKSIEAYESYARRKPPGKYRDEALRRIGEITSHDASKEIKHPRKNPPKKKQIKDTTPAPSASPTPTATAAPFAPNFVLINSIGGIASNDASQEQEAKAKRDEAQRKNALAGNDLPGGQKVLKDNGTAASRLEAQGRITTAARSQKKSDSRSKIEIWLQAYRESRRKGSMERDFELRSFARQENTIAAWKQVIWKAETKELSCEAHEELNRRGKPISSVSDMTIRTLRKTGDILGYTAAAMFLLVPFLLIGSTIYLVTTSVFGHKEPPRAISTSSSSQKFSDITNKGKRGPTMVSIPPGYFLMGSNDNKENTKPEHKVKIIRSFALSQTEITRKEWREVMGTEPPGGGFNGLSRGLDIFGYDNYPVTNVSWDDATEFTKRLSKLTGKTYRLPSEAEWEYACRDAGNSQYTYCGGNHLNDLGWPPDHKNGRTHPVAQKEPNKIGLYDMTGNVSEWVEDWYHDDFTGAPFDGRAWIDDGQQSTEIMGHTLILGRVIKGGSWSRLLPELSATYRASGNRGEDIGFRVAREITNTTNKP